MIPVMTYGVAGLRTVVRRLSITVISYLAQEHNGNPQEKEYKMNIQNNAQVQHTPESKIPQLYRIMDQYRKFGKEICEANQISINSQSNPRKEN